MKVSDCAPAPFEADYYIIEEDTQVRGAQVQNTTRPLLGLAEIGDHASSKVLNIFDRCCILPYTPSDPLYVLPGSKFTLSNISGVDVANRILSILRDSCPSSAMISTNIARMRITVQIDGRLDMKIKLFKHIVDGVLVACRRDAGDWFAFHRIYMQLKNSF